MKKTISLALCAALACALLAGCGGGKQVPPENFPHSETLRMDATVDEVVKAEGLNELVEGLYLNPASVKIDGIDMSVNYLSLNTFDRMTASYGLVNEQADPEKMYQQLKKYFTNIYGEAGDSSPYFTDSETATVLQGSFWEYSGETNETFFVCVIEQQYLDSDSPVLTVMAGSSELF